MLHVWRDEQGRLWGHRVDWLEGQGVFSVDRFRILPRQVAEAEATGDLAEVELSEPYPSPAVDPYSLGLPGRPSVFVPSDPDEDDGAGAAP